MEDPITLSDISAKQRDKLVAKLFYDKYREDVSRGDYNILRRFSSDPLYNQLIDHLDAKNAKTPLSYLLTFNFDNKKLPELSEYEKIVELMTKVINKKWVKDAMWAYSIECRDTHVGYHAHMWLSYNKRLSEVKREVFNTVKSYMGNTMHLDIKSNYTEAAHVNALKYIIGLKQDQDSLAAKATKEMRKEKDLEDYFSNQNNATLAKIIGEEEEASETEGASDEECWSGEESADETD